MKADHSRRAVDPSHDVVSRGKSGYVEVLCIELYHPQEHFEDLIRFFFQFHDPTTRNRQGNDRGSQYASCIFYSDEEQAAVATRVKEELQHLFDSEDVKCYANKRVETKIIAMTEFTEAEENHQDFLRKNPDGYWWVVE